MENNTILAIIFSALLALFCIGSCGRGGSSDFDNAGSVREQRINEENRNERIYQEMQEKGKDQEWQRKH